MKTCTKCGEAKPLEQFSRAVKHHDGLAYWCRPCQSTFHAEWWAANPHRGWANYYRRRARKFGFQPIVDDFRKSDVVTTYGDSCAYCTTGTFEELDHLVPIKSGGRHTLDNVRPSCTACNREKRDLDWSGLLEADAAVGG